MKPKTIPVEPRKLSKVTGNRHNEHVEYENEGVQEAEDHPSRTARLSKVTGNRHDEHVEYQKYFVHEAEDHPSRTAKAEQGNRKPPQ